MALRLPTFEDFPIRRLKAPAKLENHFFSMIVRESTNNLLPVFSLSRDCREIGGAGLNR
jgi:hypothetical protein